MNEIIDTKKFVTPQYITQLTDIKTHPDTGHNMNTVDLFPLEHLPRVISELEQTLVPCEMHDANDWAKKMIGMYPMMKDLASPEAYAAGIKTVMAEAPKHMLSRIVDELTRTHKYPPTRSEVAEVVDRHVGKQRAMLSHARRMEREHERRRLEAQREEEQKREREELRQKYGENYLQKFIEETAQNLKSEGRKDTE